MDVDKLIMDALDELKETIQKRLRETRTNASGKTSKSLEVVNKGHSYQLLGREYFATVERGRAPGKTPEGFVGIIKQWIVDKGLRYEPIPYKRQESAKWSPLYSPEERGLHSMASAIAHTIRTKGSELYRTGGYDDIYTVPIEDTVKGIASKLSDGLMLQVTSINDILAQLEK